MDKKDFGHIRILSEIVRNPIMITGILINMIRIFWFVHLRSEICVSVSLKSNIASEGLI